MRRIFSLSLIIIMLVGCMTFYAEASVYFDSGFRFELPEDAVINDERATKTNSTRSWIMADGDFTVDVLIKDNYNKSCYINYSEDEILESYRSYTSGYDGDHELLSGRNFFVDGFEGLRMDIAYDDTEHTVCVFSTKDTVYTVYFYAFDDEYGRYINQITDTITIEGKPYNDSTTDIIGMMFYALAFVFVVGALIYILKKKPVGSGADLKETTSGQYAADVHESDSGKASTTNNNKTYNFIEKF